jgi:predicted nucleic-acid-binding Zn-ribbon protein
LRKTRILAFVLFGLVAILLILPYLIAEIQWSAPDLATLYGLATLAIVLLAVSGPTQQQGKPPNKESKTGETKTVTSIACYNCKFSEEREFERGDYIGKTLGKCPKCKGQRYIKSIYEIQEKRK